MMLDNLYILEKKKKKKKWTYACAYVTPRLQFTKIIFLSQLSIPEP